MGWKQYARSVEAANRRQQREAASRYRDFLRDQDRLYKEEEKRQAAEQVARYELYVDSLISLHTEAGETRNWREVMSRPAPQAPMRLDRYEQQARAQANAYRPALLEKVFGGAKRRAAELATTVSVGRARDDAAFQAAYAEYQRQHALWERSRQLAPLVLRFDLRGSAEALTFCESFKELASFQTNVSLTELNRTAATLDCVLEDPDLVPKEEVKLTAGGKLSEKELTAAKYWSIYQDHVCSCAMRVARETFAVLEVQRCIVNMRTPRIDRSTGHLVPDCILAVHFTRGGLAHLRLENIDPSDAMKNFNHRMKFKKASGFETVEPSNSDEAWVSS